MSGIEVSEELQEVYKGDLKIRRKHGYLILKIEKKEGKPKEEQVQIESAGEPLPPDCTEEQNKEVFEKVKSGLEDGEPRFIIFDFRFKSSAGRNVDKLALITW